MNNLEDKRVKSEIAKNEAEKIKFQSETKKIEQSLKTNIFSLDTLLKIIIGGIVTAALISAWIIGYFQPILEKNQELAKIEAKILSQKNEEQRLLNIEVSKSLQNLKELTDRNLEVIQIENKKLKEQQAESEKVLVNLKSRLLEISNEYKIISQDNILNANMKKKFSELAFNTQREAELLKEQLELISQSKEISENRSQIINNRVNISWLMSGTWKVKFIGVDDLSDNIWRFYPEGKMQYEKGEPVGNDHHWELENETLTITLFNRHSTGTATVSDSRPTSISGKMINIEGKRWDFIMTR
jgi:hypothetical protein